MFWLTDFCQCLVMASVVSMRVPSRSNKKPAKAWVSGWPVKEPLSRGNAMVSRRGCLLRGLGSVEVSQGILKQSYT